MAPPLSEAVSSLGNRESDSRSPRGKIVDHRPSAERARRNWRVMLEDTASFSEGEVVSTRLKHALQAPNGRIIPISEAELNLWFRSFYRLVKNKRGESIAIVLNVAHHGIWGGAAVGEIHLQRGDWRIIRADDSVTKITQQHTRPLGALTFNVEAGRVNAGIPTPHDNNGTGTNSTQPRAVVHTEESPLEGK